VLGRPQPDAKLQSIKSPSFVFHPNFHGLRRLHLGSLRLGGCLSLVELLKICLNKKWIAVIDFIANFTHKE
jgi:hypothetical protein